MNSKDKDADKIGAGASGPAHDLQEIGEMSTREIYREIGLIESRGVNMSYNESLRLELLKKAANARYNAGRKAGSAE
jgi:hypothetical protein